MRRRILLTPVGPVMMAGIICLVVFGSLSMDRALGFPKLLPGAPGSVIGVVLLATGLVLSAWCVVWLWKEMGTHVQLYPPRELVTVGPYAWSRNPMMTGGFACLFGLGFFLHSASLVFVWTPVFVLLNVIELKMVEEPELERRFGTSYREYRRRVSMFVPRIPGDSKKNRRKNTA